MISANTNIKYFIKNSKKPSIIRPFSDSHWSNSKSVLFKWRYNGSDIQYFYQIQIIKKKISIRSEIDVILSSINDSEGLYEVLTIDGVGNEQEALIDLSGYKESDDSTDFIEEDGIYIWRLRTQGTIAREWSDWDETGLLRIDETAPVIRNVNAVSKTNNSNLAAYFSDLSSPYIYTERLSGSDTVKDRHVDRGNNPGLYIYYDYRDHSLVLRAQSGNKSQKRYYGLISFHENETNNSMPLNPEDPSSLDSRYSIQNLVKSIHQFSIDRRETALGPYDDIPYSDISSGKKITSNVDDLIFPRSLDRTDESDEKYIPQGFPTFITESVYDAGDFSNHPVGFNPTESFASCFPIYSRRFSSRTYVMPNTPSGKKLNLVSTSQINYIEVRYPAPYHDFFIIFKETSSTSNEAEMICFGQYSSLQVQQLIDDPNPSGDLNITRGFDVFNTKNNPEAPIDSNGNCELFSTGNTSLDSRTIKSNLSYGSSNYSRRILFSQYIFFNLSPSSQKDECIKIYFNPETVQSPEYQTGRSREGIDPTSQVEFPFVEFNFRPDADCSSVFRSNSRIEENQSIDEVYIGRSKVSPRDLPQFDISDTDESSNEKYIFKDIKVHDPSTEVKVSEWDNNSNYFNKDKSSYNGSFRLKIPEYSYVPYYHIDAHYDNNGSSNPIPYIFDSNPNPDEATNVINWDSVTIRSTKKGDDYEGALVNREFIYNSDFIKFNSTSRFLGQLYPYLFNMGNWSAKFDDSSNIFGKGKILNQKNIGNSGNTKSLPFLDERGYTLFESGWFFDGIEFNKIDRGLFALVDQSSSDSTNTNKLYIKDFSNHIFRKAIDVDVISLIDKDSDYTIDVYPSDYSSHGRTFVWEFGNISNKDISENDGGGSSNGPSWVFNTLDAGAENTVIGGITFNESEAFSSALISNDISIQGFYEDFAWMKSFSGFIGGLYLVSNQLNQLNQEQIERAAVGYDSGQTKTALMRSKVRDKTEDFPSIYSNDSSTESAYLTGDTFAMGNIFGYCYQDDQQRIKFAFDVDSGVSNIKSIKYLQVDIPVVVSSEDSLEEAKSPHYHSLNDSKVKIKIQKINNEDYDLNSLSLSDSIFDNILTSRTPMPVIEWYFENASSLTYVDDDKGDVLDIENVTDWNTSRFTFSIPIIGSSEHKIIFFKVKDKAGNESSVYAVPVFVPSSSTVVVSDSIDYAELIADARQFVTKEEISEDLFGIANPSVREFWTNFTGANTSNNRSIVLKNVVTYDSSEEEYVDHPSVSDLLVGFSDNYGLSYNVYSPYSSVNQWMFDRPIAIKMKGFSSGSKGPDWYFDPNDVRHYTPDSQEDYNNGTFGNNNMISMGSYHLPGNPGLTPRTLVGFLAEDIVNYGRSNPIAEKILENKYELIGKKLKIGSDLSQSFKILDIFRSDTLAPVKRFGSDNLEIENSMVDGEPSPSISSEQANQVFPSRPKIWILVEDPDAICVMILSRKFQYIKSDDDYLFVDAKIGTGWRENRSVIASDSEYPDSDNEFVDNFGYYQEETEVPTFVREVVNTALGVVDESESQNLSQRIPVGGYVQEYIFIDPSDFDDDSSGIDTNEGWQGQIYQAFLDGTVNPTDSSIPFSLKHYQLLGIEVYNKLIFGKPYEIECSVSHVHYDSIEDKTYLLFEDSGLDYTMRTLSFSLKNNDTNEDLDLTDYENTIDNITIDGKVISLVGDWTDILDVDDDNEVDFSCSLIISIEGHDYRDEITDEPNTRGWWPTVSGFKVPPRNRRLGSSPDTFPFWDNNEVKYCVTVFGSFYIAQDGNYTFKLDVDDYAYADLYIDYIVDKDGLEVRRLTESSTGYVKKLVGGQVVAGELGDVDGKTFYLKQGWHTSKFSYVAGRPLNVINYESYARVLYSKPEWPEHFVPLIGSLNKDMQFMARSYRTIFGRILDQDNRRYPIENWEVPSSNTEYQYEDYVLKAIAGISQGLQEETQSSGYYNRPLKATKTATNSANLSVVNAREVRPTFSGQILEEAKAIFESNIFDGGSDFRFWRSISWSLSPEDQPDGTFVEFYVRTGSTEQEILGDIDNGIPEKAWNNIGTSSDPNVIDAITEPGADLIDFSQIRISSSEEIILNRYLQFKMVLVSRSQGVTPVVNDVTISYSKQNTVNFYTTTFNLSSNIVRAILTYNGNIPTGGSGVALSEIQFGICTEEDSDGKVVTNFDKYTNIPVDEAFSLESLGVAKNDKFRVGIRFISTEGAIPTVDEFAMMWQTESTKDKVIDLKNKVSQ